MRIIKEINGYDFKITLMEYAGNLYAKFEEGMIEITLKFRQGNQIEHQAALENLISNHLADKIPAHLESIKSLVITALAAETLQPDDDFEEII